MHPSVMEFGQKVLTPYYVRGMDVLEVGSKNVNGSLKEHVLSLGPKSYLGIDMEIGPNVDKVMRAEDLVPEGWDLVICTEMMEHAKDWQSALQGIKASVKVNGWLLLTTRSPGFPRHDYPGDYWRFTKLGMWQCLRGYSVKTMIDDPYPDHPGVLVWARRTWYHIDVPAYAEVLPVESGSPVH